MNRRVAKPTTKQSKVPLGSFFLLSDGSVFFKVGPKNWAWICNVNENSGGVHRLEIDSVIDRDVNLLTLSEVRNILKKVS